MEDKKIYIVSETDTDDYYFKVFTKKEYAKEYFAKRIEELFEEYCLNNEDYAGFTLEECIENESSSIAPYVELRIEHNVKFVR